MRRPIAAACIGTSGLCGGGAEECRGLLRIVLRRVGKKDGRCGFNSPTAATGAKMRVDVPQRALDVVRR